MRIRFLRRLRPFLVFFCSSICLFSENQPPVRDSHALKIVQIAINNMGAENGASTIQDCVVTGISESDFSSDLRKEFTWTMAGDEFRFEVNGAKGKDLFVSGHGTPTNSHNEKVSRINYHMARANLPYYLPGLLLSRELANPSFSVKYVGASSVGGYRVVQVHLSDGSDKIASLVTPQDWYFDLNSGMPLRVEFRIPSNDNAADFAVGTFDFSDFRMERGMLMPFQISFSQEELPVRLIIFSSVTFNVGVSPSIFDNTQAVDQ
jgi:outer membrane lipoprotein-sorting protein